MFINCCAWTWNVPCYKHWFQISNTNFVSSNLSLPLTFLLVKMQRFWTLMACNFIEERAAIYFASESQSIPILYIYIYIRIIIQVVKIFYKHFSFQLISVSCLQHFRLKDDVLVMIYFIIVACGWCCYCYQGRYISGPLTPVFIGGSIYNL